MAFLGYRRTLVLALLALVVQSTSGITPISPPPICSTNLDFARQTAEPLLELAIDLLRRISAVAPNRNSVFSPTTIALSLGLTELGAAGESKNELDRLLFGSRGGVSTNQKWYYEALQYHLNTTTRYVIVDARTGGGLDGFFPRPPITGDTTDVALLMANGLFLGRDFTLKQEIVSMAKCYKGEIRKMSFDDPDEAARSINSWVAEATNQKIPRLLSDPTILKGAIGVLTNAVYLKAAWKERMTVMSTEKDFYRFGNENDKQKITFIRSTRNFDLASDDDVQMIRIPLTDDLLSVYILLPNARNGLQSLEQGLSSEKLESLRNRLTSRRIDLQLPRFSVRTPIALTEHLKAMGLQQVFTDQADFSGLSEEPVRLDSVLHEAYVKINENGAEAVAVAAAAAPVAPISIISERAAIPFVVDHPFIFAIVHQSTKVPVFMGEVNFVEEAE